jgi:pimeloyl-ACP methyl ester carboxylesterase
VAFLHAGIGDRRLWDQQVGPFSERHTVVRYDARGFGDSPLPGGPFSYVTDLCALLDHLGIERAAVVGNSLGARTALDFALEHARRVSALVLAGPAPLGPEESRELQDFGEREDALLDDGRIDEAVELNLDLWLASPEPELRRRVGEMQRRAFEVQVAAFEREPEPGPVRWLDDPPAWERLADVSAATLVLVGDEDVSDVLAAAERLAAGIPGARLEVVAGAGHVPGIERPGEFNRIVLEFLAGA